MLLAAIIQVEATGAEQTVAQNTADSSSSEKDNNDIEQLRKKYREVFGTSEDELVWKRNYLSRLDPNSDYYSSLIEEIRKLETDLKNGIDSKEEELLKLSIDEINNSINKYEQNSNMFRVRDEYKRMPTSANRKAYEAAMNALGLSAYLSNIIDIHAPNATEEDKQALYDAVKDKTVLSASDLSEIISSHPSLAGLTVASVNTTLNVPAITGEEGVLIKEIDSLEIELSKLDSNTREYILLSKLLPLKKTLLEQKLYMKDRVGVADNSNLVYIAKTEKEIKLIISILEEGNDPQPPYYDLSQITNLDTLILPEGAQSAAWVVRAGSIANDAVSFAPVSNNELLSTQTTVLIAERNQSDPSKIDIKIYINRPNDHGYHNIRIKLGEMTNSKGGILKTVSVDPLTAILRLKTTIARNSNNSSQTAESSV